MAGPEPQAPTIRKDGLQLDEKRRFQEWFWTTERWAWVLFALLTLLALAGLTGGGGYLSRTTASLGPAQADYPRITRWEATDEIIITLDGHRPEHQVELGQPFSSYFQIEDVQPMPEHSIAAQDAEVMQFRGGEGSPARIILHLRALHPGVARFDLSVNGSPTEATTLILP